jgi:hypothetical protein
MRTLFHTRQALLTAWLLLAAGCATPTHVLVGTPRPPIDPKQVTVYAKAPDKYEEIGIVEASSPTLASSQQKTDVLIQRLKEQAAKLGANGLLIKELSEESSASVGAGTGSWEGSVGVGIGVSTPLWRKHGSAMAIYVQEPR